MFRIDRQKATEVLGQRGIYVETLADAMGLPTSDMVAMLNGEIPFDMDETQKLMTILGFWDFAKVAADKEVLKNAKRIASKR